MILPYCVDVDVAVMALRPENCEALLNILSSMETSPQFILCLPVELLIQYAKQGSGEIIMSTTF